MADSTAEYFRGDQRDGITAPDLSKSDCTVAEHIVRARGKRTKYSSVSLDRNRIRDFGETLYRLLLDRVASDEHVLVEHDSLLAELRRVVRESDKAERARALQAIRYARRRLEALVEWKFDVSGVERKDLISWAFTRVQDYSQRL